MESKHSRRATVGGLIEYITAESDHHLDPKIMGDEVAFVAWWRRLCGWPPNVFALTSAILHESGLYRVSPRPDWNRVNYVQHSGDWLIAIEDAQLNTRCCTGASRLPDKLIAIGEIFRSALPHSLEADDADFIPAIRSTLLELHCLADEACYGLGLPHSFIEKQILKVPDSKRKLLAPQLRQDGLNRLCDTGTLSCFDPLKMRVLPKKHTPQVGVTLRSISLHVGAVRGEVRVGWQSAVPHNERATTPQLLDCERQVNLLLVPWPYELYASAFSLPKKAREAFHEFEFLVDNHGNYPGENWGPREYVNRLLKETERRNINIHGVVFPELSLTETTFEEIRNDLEAKPSDPPFLLGGVGVRSKHPHGGPPKNEAWFALKGKIVKQEKHHRWCIDASQIRQYHLGASLLADGNRRYWEHMEIGHRTLNFVHLRPGLTVCHLICEDLARVEPVAEVIRGVGPNLVIGLLLDGPQLEKRWPGRYASIFADDPGSSVLTLTSLGMVRRSRGREDMESTVVALWKDKLTGVRELSLKVGGHALVLSLSTTFVEEWTFDGRSDGGTSGVLTFAGVDEIKLPPS